jgi:hypothetical protein
MLNKEFYKYVPSYFLPLLNFVEKRYSHESWFETEFNKYADLIMHTPKKKMVAPSVYFADIAKKYKKAANDISENNDEAPELSEPANKNDIHNVEPIQKTSLNENVNNYRKNEKQNYSNYYNKNSYKNKK